MINSSSKRNLHLIYTPVQRAASHGYNLIYTSTTPPHHIICILMYTSFLRAASRGYTSSVPPVHTCGAGRQLQTASSTPHLRLIYTPVPQAASHDYSLIYSPPEYVKSQDLKALTAKSVSCTHASHMHASRELHASKPASLMHASWRTSKRSPPRLRVTRMQVAESETAHRKSASRMHASHKHACHRTLNRSLQVGESRACRLRMHQLINPMDAKI